MTPNRFGAVPRFVLLLLTTLIFSSFGASRSALADCVLNGVTVTCSGNSPGGFAAGPGVTGLTVNVQQGANVGTGILLNDGNTVSNLGTVSVGDSVTAVSANDNNTIVNSSSLLAGAGGIGIQLNNGGTIANTGTITVGDGGLGILTGNNVSVSNSGTIRFSECGSIGIFAAGSGASVTNTGSLFGTGCGTTGIAVGTGGMLNNSGLVQLGGDGTGLVGDFGSTIVNSGRVVLGADGIGIESRGNVTNSGTIIVGDGPGFAAGVYAIGDGLRVTNSGTITGGTDAAGIAIQGDNGFLVNSGTITVGEGGPGLTAFGNGNSFTNSGTITVGDLGYGILAAGNNSTISNSGTINVGGCGVGISTAGGFGSTITNSGRVLGTGCSAIGVAMGSADTLTNSGYILGSELGFSVFATGPNNTVFNSGTLDGPVNLVSTGNNSLTNSGLITVSSALTTGGGVAHSIDGFFTQTASGVLGLRVGPSATATNYDTLSVTGTTGGASGTANLGGTLRAQVQPGLYGSSTTYAGALTFTSSTGRFATVESGLTFLTASAVYNPTSVDLVLSRIPFNQLSGGSGGANSRAIGNVLEANYSTNLTGTQANFYSQLLQSSAPNTLSQLTGEVATAGQNASFAVFGQFFSTILDQTSTARSTAGTGAGTAQAGGGQQTASLRSTTPRGGTRMAVISEDACLSDICDTRPPAAARVSAWSQGFGGAGSIDRSASVGSSRVDMTAGGGATGIDVRL